VSPRQSTAPEWPALVAIPDDFVVGEMTRRQARAIVEANPAIFDGVDSGIEQLLRAPLVTGKDDDGDGYNDVSLAVNVTDREGVDMPTAQDVEAAIAATGGRRFTAQRSKIDGYPAIRSEFTLELTRSDNVTVTLHALQVSFAAAINGHDRMQ